VKKITIVLATFLISNIVCSQKYTANNIIVDSENLQPIVNVNVFNDINNTISNKNGIFTFNSNINSITISHIGCQEVVTNFTNLATIDTIFLESSVFELNEVVISDKKQLINKVYSNVAANYPFEPFTEETFVRCILRKNGSIVKLQDMVINIYRNSLFTNNDIKQFGYDIQILNLRKAGVSPKSTKEIEFKLLSIDELFKWFSAIFTTPSYYNYHENSKVDNKHLKIDFVKNENLREQKSLEGYYVINLDDFSFNEVYYNTVFEDHFKIPYDENKNTKWRTIGNELFIQYKKNIELNKYFINNGILKNTVEVISNDKKSIYEATYQIISLKHNKNIKVQRNFSPTKDLFKADMNFNSTFWSKQNQLILDNELKDFIKNLECHKKEYKIYSNFFR
jgi:hypothetical protein